MSKWEYRIENVIHDEQTIVINGEEKKFGSLSKVLSYFDDIGWELVNIYPRGFEPVSGTNSYTVSFYSAIFRRKIGF
jgi:hypothetical protein